MQRVLFTGLQPSGRLHLGNYVGSIKTVLQSQNKEFSSRMVMIADLHALTDRLTFEHSQPVYPSGLNRTSINTARILLACGVDSRCTLFLQSSVKEHAQLCWLLSCLCPQSYLNNMIQFKEKNKGDGSLGLYSYPLLMAADILLYKATHVPVGHDQTQHLQLTRKIVNRMNIIFPSEQDDSQLFPEPQPIFTHLSRLMSLTNPKTKMSKSDANMNSCIFLADTEQQVLQKIKKALTDSVSAPLTYDYDNRPALANLINIQRSLTNKTLQQTVRDITNLSFLGFKQLLAKTINNTLKNIRQRNQALSDQQVCRVLKLGNQFARHQAQSTLKQFKRRLQMSQL